MEARLRGFSGTMTKILSCVYWAMDVLSNKQRIGFVLLRDYSTLATAHTVICSDW